MKKTLHFKTNTLLKNLVGKDLINDDNIAIVELIKNSYDAESDQVLIKFENFSKEKSTLSSRIIIADEGKGMDWSDIEDKWLNIAYSEKYLQEPEDGKYLAGNKGIGRFSCDRLGAVLDLLTRKENNDVLHLKIKWEAFEIEGEKDLTIQEIPLEIVSIDEKEANKIANTSKFPSTGTILVITILRSKWDRDKLEKLKTSLEKFINPNQLFLRDQFNIELSVPDLLEEDKKKSYQDRVNGPIQNQIFEKLKFNSTYIEANISADGRILTTSLHHEGEKVFDLAEKNPYKALKKVYVTIYYLNRYKKSYFKRQTGVHSVEFGSIFLFLNGFRVPPYGNRGNDWLGLDVRRTQGYKRYLGTRDIIGRIEVSGSENQFKPISSREGLKNTDSFIQLRKKFYLDIHKKLEKFVVQGLGWDSVSDEQRSVLASAINEGLDWKKTTEEYLEPQNVKKQRIALSIMTLIGASPKKTIKFWFNPGLLEEIYEVKQQEVEKILKDIENFDTDKIDGDLSRNLSQFKDLVRKKEEEAKIANAEAAKLRVEVAEKDDEIEKLAEEKDEVTKQVQEAEHQITEISSQNLFLKSVLSEDLEHVIELHHSIGQNARTIDQFCVNLLAMSNNGKKVNEEVLKSTLEKISYVARKILTTTRFATRANFRGDAEEIRADLVEYIREYIQNIYGGIEKDLNNRKIDITFRDEFATKFATKFAPINISIVFDNLISNSRKHGTKKIEVSVLELNEEKLVISFKDDGRGVSKKAIPNLFEFGKSSTDGSGMGLYHSKNIMEGLQGGIEFNADNHKGAEFILTFTKR